MNIKDYKFKVGDEVVTTLGELGKIICICDCVRCKERGFNELVWFKYGTKEHNFITIYDAENGFPGFYKIGDYRFNDFEEDLITETIGNHEKEIYILNEQLTTIELIKREEARNQTVESEPVFKRGDLVRVTNQNGDRGLVLRNFIYLGVEDSCYVFLDESNTIRRIVAADCIKLELESGEE